jgi:uncharacterized phage protein (TIGR01671 family)
MILWTEFTEKRYNLTDFALAAQYPALYAAGMFRNSILMQFTGLLDRSGKEIYEKDLLRCSGQLTHENKYREYRIGLMDWSNMHHGFCLFLQNKEKSWEYPCKISYVPDTLEIIGNIYENPSLATP